MAQHTTPKLRFPEFSGAWEEKELNNAALINPKSAALPNSFIYIDLESVENGVLNKKVRVEKKNAPSRAQRLLKEEDILYQMVRPYQKNNLYFDLRNTDFVASTGYAQIRSKESAKYLYHYIHTDIFVNEVLLRCTGTSYPAINSNDLSLINIKFPTLPEQQKIASFLSAADKKLEQLQQKKTLLEQYKKGMMQKLFSQQIRFKDDEGKDFPEWINEKLGNLVSITSGTSPSEYKLSDNNLIPFIKVEELNNCDKYQFVSRFYTNSHKNLIAKNSIIFPKRGAAIFNNKIRLAGVPLLMDSNLMALTANDKIVPEFLYYKLMKEQLFKIADTSTLPQINNKHIEPYIIPLPTVAEQTKIAEFLTAIDAKIAAVSAQVAAAKGFKKGLLQQMFV